MKTLPNILSGSRFILALFFLSPSLTLRTYAIILALITDFLDGYLARKNRWTSRLGSLLDPIADRFFIFFVLLIIILEQHPAVWQIALFFGRDLSVGLFALYLFKKGAWKRLKLEATWCGKISTVIQLFILLSLTLSVPVGPLPYLFLLILAAMNWAELFNNLQEKHY
ncbi:MAG: CDP-alcohol phosphatidyltransferase family protein [Chlamydiota bacterium]